MGAVESFESCANFCDPNCRKNQDHEITSGTSLVSRCWHHTRACVLPLVFSFVEMVFWSLMFLKRRETYAPMLNQEFFSLLD